MSIINTNLSFVIISLLFVNCISSKFYLQDRVNESKVRKVAIPSINRISGFHQEEDLTKYCKDSEVVYVRFFMNIPKEIWCQTKEINSDNNLIDSD